MEKKECKSGSKIGDGGAQVDVNKKIQSVKNRRVDGRKEERENEREERPRRGQYYPQIISKVIADRCRLGVVE
uniref:Uncharacterized protein n=1 Tax=Vespula pensylvanica TaxID=30213 RepID=A0A836ULG5_VESPE|nr:hypothetical protein H0235_013886 [Vespula pensylvanica]